MFGHIKNMGGKKLLKLKSQGKTNKKKYQVVFPFNFADETILEHYPHDGLQCYQEI